MKELATIIDNGRWYNKSNGPNNSNQHKIDIIWNRANEKEKKGDEKHLIALYRRGREKLEIKIENNNHEIIIHELPKTKRDKQIIADRIDAGNKLIKSFGYEPSIKQDLNRFHLLKHGDLEIFSKGNIIDGFFDPLGHCISIDRSPSDVETATTVGHEKLHYESPIIFQKINGEMLNYRMGLRTYDQDGKIHLDKIDEALTSDLNYYLFKTTIQNNPLYEKELKMVNKIKSWIKEVLSKQTTGKIMLLENICLEDIYTIRGPILETLESGKSKDYKIAYLTDVIENPQDDRKLVTFERSEEVKYFSEIAHKIIATAKSKGQMIFANEIINWFAWLKFTPNDKFFEKREALKTKIDGILGEGSFEKLE